MVMEGHLEWNLDLPMRKLPNQRGYVSSKISAGIPSKLIEKIGKIGEYSGGQSRLCQSRSTWTYACLCNVDSS